MIEHEIVRELTPILLPGEEILWADRPKKGVLFRPSDTIMIPFSIVWCGFSVFWLTMALSMGAPLFFALFGVPFVLIGIYLVIGRFFADAKKRANTIYALTPDRVIIRSGLWNTTVNSIQIKSLADITLQQRPDGSGTVILRDDVSYTTYDAYRSNGYRSRRYVNQGPRLECIPNAQSVYAQILELQRRP